MSFNMENYPFSLRFFPSDLLPPFALHLHELLSGMGGNTGTKTEQAERLILDLLAGGTELPSTEILRAAAEAGISERTVKIARRNLEGRVAVLHRANQWYYALK